MSSRCWLPMLAVVVFLVSMPQGAWAYGADVHFNLTYVLCRLAGIEAKDALWIAVADQSMDANNCTSAFLDGFTIVKQRVGIDKEVYPTNGENWHDFNDSNCVPGTLNPKIPSVIKYTDGGYAARTAIMNRMNELWNHQVPHASLGDDENARITADIAMGQFLHFEQDFYSHRQLSSDGTDLDDNKFLPYGTHWGHGRDGHTPDYVVVRPKLAMKMAENSYDYICKYSKTDLAAVSSANVTPQAIDALITAIADSYKITYSTYGRTPQKTKQYGFPTSKAANGKIKIYLTSLPIGTWPGKVTLPDYESNLKALTLPYDEPTTPLESVKGKIDEYLRLQDSWDTSS